MSLLRTSYGAQLQEPESGGMQGEESTEEDKKTLMMLSRMRNNSQ